MRTAKKITSCYPQASLTLDVQQAPGDDVPPVVDGFRPDVYATLRSDPTMTIIAEAKTSNRELDSQRTGQQLSAFITYLERRGRGIFILSVPGYCAAHAKTVLWFMRESIHAGNISLIVFDCLDLWKLKACSGAAWRLL